MVLEQGIDSWTKGIRESDFAFPISGKPFEGSLWGFKITDVLSVFEDKGLPHKKTFLCNVLQASCGIFYPSLNPGKECRLDREIIPVPVDR